MKLPLRFLVPALAFAVLVGFFVVGLKRDPGEIPSPLIGKPAPAIRPGITGRPGLDRGIGGLCRPPLAPECLGDLVRRLPPGA